MSEMGGPARFRVDFWLAVAAALSGCSDGATRIAFDIDKAAGEPLFIDLEKRGGKVVAVALR